MREKFHRLWLVTGAHNGDGLLLVMRISSQHSLCIYPRARKSERSKRGVGWRGSGEGYERSKPEYGTGRNHDQLLSWWWHYRRLSTNAIFPFLEKRGIHFLPKMSSAPLFFLVPTPYPVTNSVLRWRPVLSRLFPRFQRSTKISRKRGPWTI